MKGARGEWRAGDWFSHRLRGACMERMEDGFGGAQSKSRGQLDCDRAACYSGRVWKYPVRFPKIIFHNNMEKILSAPRGGNEKKW